MKIAVVGTGYVGLVSGTCLAEVGHEVICIDINKEKIAKLKKGISPIFEPGLTELIQKNIDSGSLLFTTDLKEIKKTKVVFFALPTPPGGDGQADLSFVTKVAEDAAQIITDYTVFINKSTVPVGTAELITNVIAERTSVPFDVVSNPEFLREGFAVQDFMQPDRIVVGTKSFKAFEVLREIYQPFVVAGSELIYMDEKSSEMTKYAANTFLAAKISFMNEIANLCDLVGANVDNVRQGIGSDDRIGKRFLNAGIGYGGSCFPKDVMALEKIARMNDYDFKILNAVMEVNARQRHILTAKIIDHYGDKLKNKTFAIWGLAFKPDTDDIREAPSIDIIHELLGRGANLRVYDPEAMENVKSAIGDIVYYATDAMDALTGADGLVIVTEWQEFSVIKPQSIQSLLKDKTVFDGRNMYNLEDMAKAKLDYKSIGRSLIKEEKA